MHSLTNEGPDDLFGPFRVLADQVKQDSDTKAQHNAKRNRKNKLLFQCGLLHTAGASVAVSILALDIQTQWELACREAVDKMHLKLACGVKR